MVLYQLSGWVKALHDDPCGHAFPNEIAIESSTLFYNLRQHGQHHIDLMSWWFSHIFPLKYPIVEIPWDFPIEMSISLPGLLRLPGYPFFIFQGPSPGPGWAHDQRPRFVSSGPFFSGCFSVMECRGFEAKKLVNNYGICFLDQALEMMRPMVLQFNIIHPFRGVPSPLAHVLRVETTVRRWNNSSNAKRIHDQYDPWIMLMFWGEKNIISDSKGIYETTWCCKHASSAQDASRTGEALHLLWKSWGFRGNWRLAGKPHRPHFRWSIFNSSTLGPKQPWSVNNWDS